MPTVSWISFMPSFRRAAMYRRRSSISSSGSPKAVSCGMRLTMYFHFLLNMLWIISSVLGPSSQLKPQLQITSGSGRTPIVKAPSRILFSGQ